MIGLVITPDLEQSPWRDLARPDVVVISVDTFDIGRLPRGTEGGKSSVAIRIDLPDGRVVIAQTTMALFQSAARVFKAKDEELGIMHP